MTHYNWNIKNQREHLKSSKKKTLIIYKETPIRLSAVFFQQKLYKWEGSGMKYWKFWKKKIYSQEYFTQQGHHSELET